MALRIDQGGTFASVETTPTGGIRVDARVSRVGVFPYTFADGRVQRELRHPDEVFDEKSLATLRGAAVTDDHPPELVGPSTWRKVSIGHVGDHVRAESRFVAAPLLVQDGEAIPRVGKDLIECSCGYDAEFDPTPGVWEGEPYDGIQRKIRYNHVALGPEGWGRAGQNVRLRLDAGSAICHDMSARLDSAASPAAPPPARRVRVDGIDYDAGSESHLSAVEKHTATLAAQVATERARAEAAEKRADTEKVRADKAEAAATPAAIQAAARARADLLAKAGRLKIFYDARGVRTDKKSEDEAAPADMSIVDDILKELGVDVSGLDDAGKMLALKVAWRMKNGAAPEAPETPVDAAPNPDPNKPPVGPPLDSTFARRDAAADARTEEAALKRANERNRNAWRTPAKGA